MSKRCYCKLRSEDFASPNYKDLAIATLTRSQTETFSVEETQLRAWEAELEILKDVALSFPDCTIALEYMIPRMGKRVDALLLTHGIVFPIEFKVGETRYPLAALDQVADYAFDLKNFHMESHDRVIVPILVCTEAKPVADILDARHEGIYEVLCANSKTLADIVAKAVELLPDQALLDHTVWMESGYCPTPTIIEAAQALYESNEVEDISRHEADLTDINATTGCIDEIVEYSKANSKKSICFVTGVPGAGKTLVGLNIASKRRPSSGEESAETAVFLSGNGPLIDVLQEALTRDQQSRDDEACALCSKDKKKLNCAGCTHFRTKGEIGSEVKSFVQIVHHFRDELFASDLPPAEHIAVFDEAQRAWTKQQMVNKAKQSWVDKENPDRSEPECLIEYMDRLDDWAVMVCLVGGGQEINDGEAGISEWFKALRDKFPHWTVFASPEIDGPNYLGQERFDQVAGPVNFREMLHLGVDMRSFRNKNVAAFAEAIVEERPDEAAALYEQIIGSYPIYLTRDLEKAKRWVREQTKRPSDRYGIIADSHGERIRADGIIVPKEFKAATWFLDGKDNIDSSYFMEVAASEFKIQGLEIDYAVVAWEADYRYEDGGFGFHRFRGKKWQNINDAVQRRYLKNGYRVLLTRARQGFVIYVPRGSETDPTRLPAWYDATYQYLRSAGIREL